MTNFANFLYFFKLKCYNYNVLPKGKEVYIFEYCKRYGYSFHFNADSIGERTTKKVVNEKKER